MKKILHQEILQDLEGRILSGEWPPGHRVPFEVELASAYKCSRMTVNKVLTQLVRSGLIERRRRLGSWVAQPRVQSAILQIRDIESEVQSLGLPYSYKLVSRARRKYQKRDHDRIKLPVGTSVLELVCLHSAAARPFCLEQRVINLEAVPDAAVEGFEQVAPGPWLLKQVPWSSAEHVIRSVAADAEIASALQLEVGAPCLVVERRTAANGGTNITHVRLTYSADRHEVVAHFTPSDLPTPI